MTKNDNRLTHDERRLRREKIAMMAKNGASRTELVRRFGVGISTIREACSAYGVPVPPSDRLGSIGRKSLLVAKLLTVDGKSQSEVAKELGVSRQYVHQVANMMVEVGLLEIVEVD